MELVNQHIVFGKQWFQQNQKLLLWFINSKQFGKSFKDALGIDTDCKVFKVLPNCYHYYVGNGKCKAVFFSGDVIGKRLYRNYNLLWNIFHWWDTKFANKVIPALNVGFDTLTVYPDADPESTSVDGYVGVFSLTGSSWATLWGGSSGNEISSADDSIFMGIESASTTNLYTRLSRGITTFDTSSLPDYLTSVEAMISLYPVGSNNGLGSLDLDIVRPNLINDNAIEGADYDERSWEDYVFGSCSYATWSGGGAGYKDINLSDGLMLADLTGTICYGQRISCDTDNSAPTWSSSTNSYFKFYSADYSSGSYAPKLTITYGGGWFPSMIL